MIPKHVIVLPLPFFLIFYTLYHLSFGHKTNTKGSEIEIKITSSSGGKKDSPESRWIQRLYGGLIKLQTHHACRA